MFPLQLVGNDKILHSIIHYKSLTIAFLPPLALTCLGKLPSVSRYQHHFTPLSLARYGWAYACWFHLWCSRYRHTHTKRPLIELRLGFLQISVFLACPHVVPDYLLEQRKLTLSLLWLLPPKSLLCKCSWTWHWEWKRSMGASTSAIHFCNRSRSLGQSSWCCGSSHLPHIWFRVSFLRLDMIWLHALHLINLKEERYWCLGVKSIVFHRRRFWRDLESEYNLFQM